MGGEDIILSEKMDGKKSVVLIWWSLKNKKSILALQAMDSLAKKHKKVTFIAMNIGDTFEDINKHFRNKKWTVLMGRDNLPGKSAKSKAIHEYYNIYLLPCIVVIKHVTEDMFIGYTSKTSRSLEKVLKVLK